MPLSDPKQPPATAPIESPISLPTSKPVNTNPPPTPIPEPTPKPIPIKAVPVTLDAHRIDPENLKNEIESGARKVDFNTVVCPSCKSTEHTGAGVRSAVFVLVVCTTCWTVYANKILSALGERV